VALDPLAYHDLTMKHRFFLKLLASFAAAGLLPAVLLALAVHVVLVGQLKAGFEAEARAAGADLVRGFEAETTLAGTLVAQVAGLPEVGELVDNPSSPGARALSLVSRQLANLRRDAEGTEVHLVAEGNAFYATSGTLPEVYRTGYYGSWGLLGRARANPGQTVLFPSRAEGVAGGPAAVSAARFLQGRGHSLWVVADLARDRLYRRSGLAGQTLFQEVSLVDAQGTVILDLRDPGREDRESAFRPPEGPGISIRSAGLVLALPVSGGAFGLEASVPLNQLALMTQFLQGGSVLAAGISLLVSLALAWGLSRSVSRPVSQLVESMARVEAGNFSARLTTRRHDELGEAFERFNVMVDRLLALMDQTREEQRLLRISETKALQAQINPHFLNNTLNSIKALATEGRTEDIRTVVVALGRLLRSNIDNRAETETVEACLKLLAGYFDIENLRFGGRFSFVVDVDEDLRTLPIPRFLLQPLVENSLVHGLESQRGPGKVVLTGRRRGLQVVFSVDDDGVGIDPAALEALRASLDEAGDPGPHVGLRNVHRRLVLLFGPGAGLTLDSVSGRGTVVTLRWTREAPC